MTKLALRNRWPDDPPSGITYTIQRAEHVGDLFDPEARDAALAVMRRSACRSTLPCADSGNSGSDEIWRGKRKKPK